MKNEQPTLIILSPGFAKNEADNTCLPFLQNFIIAFNHQYPAYKIIVIAFDYPFIKNTYQWHGNTIHSFNGLNKRKIKKLFKFIAISRKINETRKMNNVIGLLSLWCNECAHLGSLYAKKHVLPHFCWLLGQDAKKQNHHVQRIKPSPANLIAISDFTQKEFKKNHGILPQRVIPLGINANIENEGLILKDIDVMAAGSLIALKQFDVFLSIIKQLKDHISSIKVLLCGAGPEEKHLLQLMAELNLEDTIVLTGELPHAKILQQMKRAKVFLHTSNYEGFSAVCLEALNAGARVISFCKPMEKDIAGWEIANSKEEMVTKALAILCDPAIIYSSTAPFTIEKTVKQIFELYGHKEIANAANFSAIAENESALLK